MQLLQVLGWPQQAALNLSLHQGEVEPHVEDPGYSVAGNLDPHLAQALPHHHTQGLPADSGFPPCPGVREGDPTTIGEP